jgi:pyruvate/2-oxoglutarate/acetoin dehydrogenase E1 component
VALEAAEQMGADHSIEVIDLRTLTPLDRPTLVESVKKTGRAIVVHEAPRQLGMGAEISAILMEEAFLYLKAPVARVSGYDVIMPYYQLENDYLPTAAKVMQAIRETLRY